MKRRFKIGMIGCGNMGGAVLDGLLKAGAYKEDQIAVSVRSRETKKQIERRCGVKVFGNNAKLAKSADILILAVKPAQFAEVAEAVREELAPDQIVISIMAGKSIAQIEEALITIRVAGRLKVVRAMPNTPAKVGESMTGISYGKHIDESDISRVMPILSSFGRVEVIKEEMMDVFTGLCGSSPAFIYMMMEAMADTAVAHGMTRDLAYRLVSQTVLGSAKMLRDSGEHPGKLKDDVTSPGGTTIAGVLELERLGFRSAIADGVDAAVERSKEL